MLIYNQHRNIVNNAQLDKLVRNILLIFTSRVRSMGGRGGGLSPHKQIGRESQVTPGFIGGLPLRIRGSSVKGKY